jgi:MFS family permease
MSARKEPNMKKNISPGFVLFMMLLSMTAGALCMNKVAPIIPTLSESMGLTGAWQAGLLVSVFVFSGIFLALPSGIIITKLGYYKTGLIALSVTLVGSIIGGLNPGYEIMLGGRVVEGIGLILLMAVGPAATASVFDDSKRGSAMGLLMCFMPIGQAIMFNLAPRVAQWELIWWGTAVYAIVLLLIWFFAFRHLDAALASPQKAVEEQSAVKKKSSLLPREVFCNKGIWLIGFTLLFYLIADLGSLAFLPTFLSEVQGMDPATAGSIVSLAPLVGIPFGIITGIISDKIGSRKWPLGILMIASGVAYALMPTFPVAAFFALITFFGMVAMGIVGLCFSAVAELVESHHDGVAVGMLNTFQWVGIFLSGSLVGLFIEWFGWSVMFYILVLLSVLGAVCAFLTPKLR